MKYNAIKSEREMHQVADMAVVATIGCLAAALFGFSPWLTIVAAFVLFQPLRPQPQERLWRKPTIRLVILVLTLAWLASGWSSYRQGVFFRLRCSINRDAALNCRTSRYSQRPCWAVADLKR